MGPVQRQERSSWERGKDDAPRTQLSAGKSCAKSYRELLKAELCLGWILKRLR